MQLCQDAGPQRVAVRAFPAPWRLAPPHAALAALLLTACAADAPAAGAAFMVIFMGFMVIDGGAMVVNAD